MDLYWIEPGLAISSRPRGGDWLEDEMRALVAAGVGMLVSCLTRAEEEELDLGAEEDAALAAGLAFVRAPTPDRSTPSAEVADRAVREIEVAQKEGRSIAVHCRQGLGRAPLVAGASLIARGVSSDDAWALISTARGVAVPETSEQRDWLEAFGQRRRFERMLADVSR